MTPDELRRRRQALGISQDQLARALSVHGQSVAHWEQGFRPVSMAGAVDLALWALEHGAPIPTATPRGRKKIEKKPEQAS